jgi:hypothetical protein
VRKILLAAFAVFTIGCGGLASLARDASCEKFTGATVSAATMAGVYLRDDAAPKPRLRLNADSTFDVQNAACLSGSGTFALVDNRIMLKHTALISGCTVSRMPVLSVCQIALGSYAIMEESASRPCAHRRTRRRCARSSSASTCCSSAWSCWPV